MIRPGQSPETVFGENNNLPFAGVGKWLITDINMNQMNIELSKMQLIHLRNICKKGWGGYSKPSDDLEEMVKNGLLTKSAGPFGDVVYRPTDAGRSYINDFNNEQK